MTRHAASASGTHGTALVDRLRAAGCVFAEQEAEVLVGSARDADHLERLVRSRVAGRPLEHVVGWAELDGVRVSVSDGVFVPRRRSQLLVRLAASAASACSTAPRPVVVDLCCGCGAVGVAAATRLRDVELHASDVDPAAVADARRNVEPLGGRVHEGDLYDALPADLLSRVDVLVVNAPYVPTSELGLLPAEARDHEPRSALDGGADGVDVHRRVAQGAASWLAASGVLLVETSERQADLTRVAFEVAGLTASVVHDDDLDATVVVGSPARSPYRRLADP